MNFVTTRPLTDPESNHLLLSGALIDLLALFFILLSAVNIVVWVLNFRKCLQSGKGYRRQVLYFLVCGFLVFSAGALTRSAWNILRDYYQGQVWVFEAKVMGHQIAKGRRWSYYLDFDASAPVSQLKIQKDNYDLFPVGSPVTVTYTPLSQMVLDINGHRNY